MKILFIIVALAIAVVEIFVLIRVRYDLAVKKNWQALKAKPTNTIFTKNMVADLDEPVQRYFLHAIAPGTSLAAYTELEMSGSFRLKPDADWMPIQASEIISTSPGFVWKAKVGSGLKQFSGADYYSQGRGRMRFFILGLIGLVDAQNENISRSGSGRLGAEYIWLPSALLPQNGVTWQALPSSLENDNDTIQANFKIDNEPITLTLTINSDGKLLKMSLPRWGNQIEDDDWQYIPFGGEVQAEQTFSGYTVPSRMKVGWWFGKENYFEFFQATIERAKFS